jgi:HEAT repeat protein
VRFGVAAVPSLVKSLGNAHVRDRVAVVLGKIGQPAVEPLIKALADERRREGGAAALGAIGAPAIGPLRKVLRQNQSAAQCSIVALSRIGAPAIPTLIEALETKKPPARRPNNDGTSAMRAKAAKRENALPTRTRCQICQCLGKMGVDDAQVVQALAKSLDDDPLRDSAAEALAKLGLRALVRFKATPQAQQWSEFVLSQVKESRMFGRAARPFGGSYCLADRTRRGGFPKRWATPMRESAARRCRGW